VRPTTQPPKPKGPTTRNFYVFAWEKIASLQKQYPETCGVNTEISVPTEKNPGERHLQRCRSDLRFQPLVEHGVMELPGQRHRHLGRAKNPPATRLVQTVTTLSKAACDVPEQGGPKSPNQSQHQNGAAAPPVNQIVL
jgi:hypothetical protein